jgi:hypothetical protein
MDMPRVALLVAALMAFSASAGALVASAVTDENKPEPVEECLIVGALTPPAELVGVTDEDVARACGFPVEDIEEIRERLTEG